MGPLIYSSFRRKPESRWLILLDPGLRRDDKNRINQSFLIFIMNGQAFSRLALALGCETMREGVFVTTIFLVNQFPIHHPCTLIKSIDHRIEGFTGIATTNTGVAVSS